MSEGADEPTPLRRNWDFQVLWITQTISSTGQSISTIAYPLLILGLTGSATKAGLLGTVVAICRYSGAVILAPAVDRVDRRTLLIVCDTVRAATAAGVSVLILIHHVPFGAILVLAGLAGFVTSPVGSAVQAAIVRVVPDSQLEQATAQDLARSDAAGLAGNGVAGLLLGIASAVPFAAQAAGYVASIVGALSIRHSLKVERDADERTGWFASNRAGLQWLLDRPTILAVGTSLSILNFAFAAGDVLVIIFARRSGATSFETGLAVAMGSAAAILGALVATRVLKLVGPTFALLIPIWVTVVAIPLFAIAPGFIGLGLVLSLESVLVPTANVVLMSNLNRAIPDSMRGRVWSFLGLAISGISSIGPLVGGSLADSLGRAGALPLTAPALACALGFTLVPTLRNYAKTPIDGTAP